MDENGLMKKKVGLTNSLPDNEKWGMLVFAGLKSVGGKRRHLEKDALVWFETTLTLNPNPVEAQAALSNKACCHAYRRGEGKKTVDCLRSALIEYDFKFATILNDPDLASLRVLPEFKQLQEEVLSSVILFACDNARVFWMCSEEYD
ncbi:hypothetical protein Tco_0373605 [Tanacetum coccineum]